MEAQSTSICDGKMAARVDYPFKFLWFCYRQSSLTRLFNYTPTICFAKLACFWGVQNIYFASLEIQFMTSICGAIEQNQSENRVSQIQFSLQSYVLEQTASKLVNEQLMGCKNNRKQIYLLFFGLNLAWLHHMYLLWSSFLHLGV